MKKIEKKYNNLDKKFIEIYDNLNEWEIETDEGWVDIEGIGKTIPYNIWEIKLENGCFLKAADKHIIIIYKNNIYKETFIDELELNDLVITKNGISKIISIKKLDISDNMYDIQIKNNNHLYYTNNILSHNSLVLNNLAAKSIQMGHNTVYITLELQEEIVNMRIGSNMLNIPIDDYETISEDEDLIRKKINNLISNSLIPLGELHVKEFPTSSTSSNDIEAYIKKLEEIKGKKFKNVFIDYINIMKNWRNPNSENTYLKIKQISEDLRGIAMINNWSIISCTQTNRGGWTNSDLSILNIAESAALTHTVDVLFGIITSPEMKAAGEYYFKCLLDRVAGYENTKKRYTVDWHYMRIEEDTNSPIQDMDFIVNHVVAGQQHPRGLRVNQSQIAIAATHTTNITVDEDIKNAELFGTNI